VRRDPVTGTYGPADVAWAVDLAYVHEEFVRGRWSLAGEVRLRLDGLGLTPKGKRDLRWRSPGEVTEMAAPAAAAAGRRRLRVAAVDPRGLLLDGRSVPARPGRGPLMTDQSTEEKDG